MAGGDRASKMRRSPGSMKNSGCHCAEAEAVACVLDARSPRPARWRSPRHTGPDRVRPDDARSSPHLGGADDAMQQRAAADCDSVAARGAVWLLVSSAPSISGCAGSACARATAKLLAPQVRARHVAPAPLVRANSAAVRPSFSVTVSRAGPRAAVRVRIDIERAPGDAPASDAVEISSASDASCGGAIGAHRRRDGVGVVLPDRIPGIFRVAARLLGISVTPMTGRLFSWACPAVAADALVSAL